MNNAIVTAKAAPENNTFQSFKWDGRVFHGLYANGRLWYTKGLTRRNYAKIKAGKISAEFNGGCYLSTEDEDVTYVGPWAGPFAEKHK